MNSILCIILLWPSVPYAFQKNEKKHTNQPAAKQETKHEFVFDTQFKVV